MVAAVVLAVVLGRPGDGGSGDGGGGELFLQAAGSSGPDPFTESTATDSSAPPVTPSVPSTPTQSPNVTRGIDGSSPGLYGGTRNNASCDVEKQVSVLQADSAKNKAFASVQRIQASEVPAYLRSLTPLQLRWDTRVTNHGYRDGRATPYQAVLQTGTAVLVDDRGVPRARCACGNPLLPPVPQKSMPRPTGDSWPSYRPQNVVVVSPSTTVIYAFVVYDPDKGDWFERQKGDQGVKDKKTDPPKKKPSPSTSVSDSPPTSPPTSPTPSSPEPPTPDSTPTEPGTETETEPPPDSPTDGGTTPYGGTTSDGGTTDGGTTTGGDTPPGATTGTYTVDSAPQTSPPAPGY